MYLDIPYTVCFADMVEDGNTEIKEAPRGIRMMHIDFCVTSINKSIYRRICGTAIVAIVREKLRVCSLRELREEFNILIYFDVSVWMDFFAIQVVHRSFDKRRAIYCEIWHQIVCNDSHFVCTLLSVVVKV